MSLDDDEQHIPQHDEDEQVPVHGQPFGAQPLVCDHDDDGRRAEDGRRGQQGHVDEVPLPKSGSHRARAIVCLVHPRGRVGGFVQVAHLLAVIWGLVGEVRRASLIG